mgnify:CR=1 FL=1
MAYETKENTGVLFPNKNKKEDKHPDYTGKALITPDMVGKEIQCAGWINDAKSGGKYMGLVFSEFKPKGSETREYTTTAPDNAEIPF